MKAKAIFTIRNIVVFTRVSFCPQREGGCVPGRHPPRQIPPGQIHSRADTPTGQTPPPGQTPPSPTTKKMQRTVRTLLECILVSLIFSLQYKYTDWKQCNWKRHRFRFHSNVTRKIYLYLSFVWCRVLFLSPCLLSRQCLIKVNHLFTLSYPHLFQLLV